MKTAGRRPLKFASLGEVMPDVDRLMEGQTRVGRWSLAQVCNHLNWGFLASIEGIPSARGLWFVRNTIGPMILRYSLKTEAMPEGFKIPTGGAPKPGLDDRAEVEALRAAVQVFRGYTGAFPDSPIFGPVSREEVEHMQRIHCAHHLSFLSPTLIQG